MSTTKFEKPYRNRYKEISISGATGRKHRKPGNLITRRANRTFSVCTNHLIKYLYHHLLQYCFKSIFYRFSDENSSA